ncbi:MAG TPA: type VI secretion system baseplate subunit TssE [Gammaproteobacteria bacterium]|nr:type VI secretion system baseplate subunit TssE [Gammaproteobacteria bacterium]
MKNLPHKPMLMATLLDQLINAIPDNAYESIQSQHQKIEQLHVSVRRDLENLLNTRRPEFTWPVVWRELNQSLLNYGIADLTGRDLSSIALQNKLCEELAATIELFETRLQQVKVKLQETSQQSDRMLRIRIEAVLVANVTPEYIIFDSVLEPDIGSFRIMETD